MDFKDPYEPCCIAWQALRNSGYNRLIGTSNTQVDYSGILVLQAQIVTDCGGGVHWNDYEVNYIGTQNFD